MSSRRSWKDKGYTMEKYLDNGGNGFDRRAAFRKKSDLESDYSQSRGYEVDIDEMPRSRDRYVIYVYRLRKNR